MLFWTPHFSVLDSTFFVLNSEFWLDSTFKIDPAQVVISEAGGKQRTNLFDRKQQVLIANAKRPCDYRVMTT